LPNLSEFDNKDIYPPEFKSFPTGMRMDVDIMVCGLGRVGQAFANLSDPEGQGFAGAV
jgi:hypothetical protein